MSKRESLLRQRLIIDRLKRRSCSFEEIQDYLKLQEELLEDRLVCSKRTFQRDIREIESFFSIEIAYNRSSQVYEIVMDGQEEQHERLMETFELYNALQVSGSFTNHMILEKRKPLGTEHMHGLLHAIKNHVEVIFVYEKYHGSEQQQRNVQPLAIKEARNRWYLLAKDLKDDTEKSFGLDRISELEISNRKFEPVVDYRAEEEYQHCFGIISGTGQQPVKVVLSFTPTEARYVKSLPLHKSQEVLLDNEKECRFSYYLKPTYDFEMEILSYGNQVRVLEPRSLHQSIKDKLTAALAQYN